MTNNYAKIVQDNLKKLFDNLSKDLAMKLPARQENKGFFFDAFGEACIIEPGKITLGECEAPSVMGILLSLYALNVSSDICVPTPFRAFKSFPDSMPYTGAFAINTEQALLPYVDKIEKEKEKIYRALKGEDTPAETAGDFAFVVYPLPKVALCYIFYEADEDFPASVTCLYNNNADRFMPLDGLADVGEYTSKKIINLIS